MKYEEAMKLWAINRLKEDKVEGEVEDARIDYHYEEGCPTCGGTVEFEVDIFYHVTLKGKKIRRYHRVRRITFDEILRQLFLLTE